MWPNVLSETFLVLRKTSSTFHFAAPEPTSLTFPINGWCSHLKESQGEGYKVIKWDSLQCLLEWLFLSVPITQTFACSSGRPGPEPGTFHSFCYLFQVLQGLGVAQGVWNLFSAGDLRGSQPTRSQQQFSARVSWAHLELWQCLPQYRLTTCITQCLQKQKWGLYLLYFPSFLCKLPLWWSDALGLTHRALETTQGTQGFIA